MLLLLPRAADSNLNARSPRKEKARSVDVTLQSIHHCTNNSYNCTNTVLVVQ